MVRVIRGGDITDWDDPIVYLCRTWRRIIDADGALGEVSTEKSGVSAPRSP